ncbi:oxoglutarate-dependent flavonoid 7-O-demethylase 1-like [Mercurialis annua]|uniref:oxoglutarate-dependent flavonoid 7-O-demethylase 1-like n=1 Tax=Mercurialis annua TaxID=3986 RepID=UPI00215F83F7|nr:oxoglutarate-dependent flavonoid 7-O-demethylase 1-like [Mercurialis annua]
MEAKITKLGSSIPVPCVQELAKESSTTVPLRYVRPHQDSPIIFDSASLPQVPVIDLQRLFSQEFMDLELNQLHHACKEWGFFQLINHEVSTSLVEKVKVEIEEFFKLPMEEKMKYWQKAGEIEGLGQAFVVSEEQKLDWGDMFYMITLPHYLRKPHLFPNLPLSFRESLEAYSEEMKNLALRVLNLMAKALGMEPKEMTEAFEDGCQQMRMNYYPPCPQPELVMGLNSHSDGGGLTILLQVSDVEGLQIKYHGKWVPVKPLPNAFIVNIGGSLEVLTNGVYKTIEHRATVNSDKERISIATFYSPKLDGEMGPAPSLVTSERPAEFRKIGVADFWRSYLSKELNGTKYLDFLRVHK